MTTTLEHPVKSAIPSGGGLARHQNAATGIVCGVVFAYLFWLVSHMTLDSTGRPFGDQVATFACVGWMIGFWIGIGAFNGPFRWLLGRDHTHEDDLYYAGQNQGKARYWKFTTDHKVVGVQYICVTMGLLGVGGILAMAMRTESPHAGQSLHQSAGVQQLYRDPRHGDDPGADRGHRRTVGELRHAHHGRCA